MPNLPGTVTITKAWTFDAAHRLPRHDGKCARPHGHTYRLTLAVAGTPNPNPDDPDHGMVLDYAHLARFWTTELEPLLDHRDLNATLGPLMGGLPTTAESIAQWALREAHRANLPVAWCEVSETPGTTARAE